MPYRAIIWTMVTVGLALAVMGMWAKGTAPILDWMHVMTAQESHGNPGASTSAAEEVLKSKAQLKGTILVSFVLICLLLVVGFFATLREWMRYRGGPERKGKKTKYVDAWKIAGQRLRAKDPDEGSEGPGPGA